MNCLEEKKQELEDPKEPVNLGGFYVCSLVHTVRKKMR